MNKDKLIQELTDRLNACHSAIDSATEYMADMGLNMEDSSSFEALKDEIAANNLLFKKIKEEPVKELRVYVVSCLDIKYTLTNTSDNDFMDVAEAEGKVYSLAGFVEAFNKEGINMATEFIRII